MASVKITKNICNIGFDIADACSTFNFFKVKPITNKENRDLAFDRTGTNSEIVLPPSKEHDGIERHYEENVCSKPKITEIRKLIGHLPHY
jgi:hypothetical protein